MIVCMRIDAWLERKNPRIRLLDADSGRELFRLGAEQVRELMESGEFCPADFENDVHCAEVIVLLRQQMAG